MTGLYVPLDVEYANNPKILRAGAMAELLYVRSLALAKRLMENGEIDTAHLRSLSLGIPGKPSKHAEALVKEGLWTVRDGGWLITAWLKRNASKAEIEAAAELAKEAGVRGNHERWHLGPNAKSSPRCPLCVGTRSGGRSGGDRVPETGAIAKPEEEPEEEPEGRGAGEPAGPTTPGLALVTPSPSAPPKRKKTTKATTPEPEDVTLTDGRWNYASGKGMTRPTAEEQWAEFLDHHRAKANGFADWDLAWANWCRRWVRYGSQQTTARSSAAPRMLNGAVMADTAWL